MTTATAMLDTHPGNLIANRDLLAHTIDELIRCSQTCTACADACLSEPDVVDLITCIRRNLDCADVCDATARLLTRQSGEDLATARAMLQTCVVACRTCQEVCRRHADHHEHCRVCADACDRCRQVCEQLLISLS